MKRLHCLTCVNCHTSFYVSTKVFNQGRKYCSRACYFAGKLRPPVDRSWEKVNKDSGHWWNGIQCWDWTAARLNGKYGLFTPHKEQFYAHRYAYELTYGPIADGMNCLHRCDRPCCVNPAHLFLGTHQDNMDDMRAKGRTLKGERVGNAKLTSAQVVEIRSASEYPGYQDDLAAKYGITQGNVSDIRARKSWTHL